MLIAGGITPSALKEISLPFNFFFPFHVTIFLRSMNKMTFIWDQEELDLPKRSYHVMTRIKD